MSAVDENPNCARTYASFRLRGGRLVAAEVTRLLQLDPDFAAEKGELRGREAREPVEQRTGVWLITSEAALETTSIERHIRSLLDRIEPVSAALRELVARDGLEADFFCYWVSATGHGGPELSSDILRRIADLGASLAYDFYGPFPEDGGDA